MWVETAPETLWQQQVDDYIWENIGASLSLLIFSAHVTVLRA